MLTYQAKRKENIIEYILQIFQIEDILRAFNLNLQQIENTIIKPLNLPETAHKEMLNWYSNLIILVEKDKIQKTGHFQFIKNLISDLHDFHLRLLTFETDQEYLNTYKSVAGLINEFKRKTTGEMNQIEVCLTALYGVYLLKLSNKPITNETLFATNQFEKWLTKLSNLFLRFEAGDFEF